MPRRPAVLGAYRKHVERLRVALNQQEFAGLPMGQDDLAFILRRNFTEDDFDYFNDLVYQTWTPLWYVVDAEDWTHTLPLLVESPKEAMATLLTRYATQAPFDQVVWDAPALSSDPPVPEPRIALHVGRGPDERIFEARGVPVSQDVLADERQRVEALLQYLRSRGQSEAWQHGLEGLGLALTEPVPEGVSDTHSFGNPKLIVRTPASLAWQLQYGLAEYGHQVSTTRAQELTTILAGAPNWATLLRHQDQRRNFFPAVLQVELSGEPNLALFRRYADAVWAFAAKVHDLEARGYVTQRLSLTLERANQEDITEPQPCLRYEGRHRERSPVSMQAVQWPRARKLRFRQFVAMAANATFPGEYVQRNFGSAGFWHTG